MAYCKLESIVLNHHARYTEADIIPCTGEEPGEAKEREALRGAVLKQVWAQAWAGGTEEWEAPKLGSTQYPPSGLSCLPSGLTFFVLLFPSGGPPSTRITPEFSKWASDGKSGPSSRVMRERGHPLGTGANSSPTPHLCCPVWPEHELPLCLSRDAIYQQW